MRRKLLKLMALSLGSLVAQALHAQPAPPFPSRPIRIVAPFPPGGPSDSVLRAVADRMRVTLGQAVVVDNRPGAGGAIGTENVAHSAPDGYSLLFAGSSLTMLPSVSKVSYDAAKDFAPVSQILELAEFLVVRSDVPVRSLQEFVSYLKKSPGKLNFASAGKGAVTDFQARQFMVLSGTEFIHVPYKGAAAALTDLLGGRVEATFDGYSSVGPYIQNGQLRPLAVALPRRSSVLPNVPTLAEAGYPKSDAVAWAGILAPAGTPKDIIARLNVAVVDAVNNADVQARLQAMGGEPSSSTAEAFGERIRREAERWPAIARSLGITPE